MLLSHFVLRRPVGDNKQRIWRELQQPGQGTGR